MSSTKKTETAQAEAVQAAEAKEPEKVVWCGPTVRGVAAQYTVFIGGAPQRVQDFIAKYPIAASLLVPDNKFTEVRARICSGKGAECIIIRNLLKQIKEV